VGTLDVRTCNVRTAYVGTCGRGRWTSGRLTWGRVDGDGTLDVGAEAALVAGWVSVDA